ncbi:MAG: hypothetical protein RLY16_944 [Bacteroidota bacterium]
MLCSLVIFQSCFDIVEQVFIKQDGSGNFQITLNFSKSKTKLNSMMKMKTVNGHPVPSQQEIKDRVAGIEKSVAKIGGISQVKSQLDFDNFIATFSCSFSKVNQLNLAVQKINAEEKGNKENVGNLFQHDNQQKTFSRLNTLSLKKEYDKMTSADREIFTGASYTTIYKFEQSVVSVSNAAAKVAPSKKAVLLRQNVLDIITNKKNIDNKIQLSN